MILEFIQLGHFFTDVDLKNAYFCVSIDVYLDGNASFIWVFLLPFGLLVLLACSRRFASHFTAICVQKDSQATLQLSAMQRHLYSSLH